MQETTNQNRNTIWLLLGLSALLLFPGLGMAPLWILDEARNAECAREMYERNDWIVPTFNGQLRTDKPPLHYFFMFAGYAIFGITEWGARIFSAVFGLLTIFITFFFISRFSSARHALITCLILLSSTHFLFVFRMSVPDPYLIFLNTLSIFTAYGYFMEKRFSWLVICAASFGLGVLAKGPIAIVLPGGAVFFWLIGQRKFVDIFSWKILMAALIMIAVALPWYIAVFYATNGAFTKGFFYEHNINRFSEPMEGHGGLFILIPLFVLIGLLPSSVFIGESLKNFKKRFNLPYMRLAFCVMAVFIAFYSISGTKLPNYPMPCYPFVALIIGYYINKVLKRGNKEKSYPFIILLVLNIAFPAAGYFALKNEPALAGFENYSVVLILLTMAGAIGLYLFRKGNFKRAAISIFVIYTFFNVIFLNWFYPVIYQNNPMSKTIDTVKKYDHVISYKIFHPSYAFYLPERIRVFNEIQSLKSYLYYNKAVIITRLEFLEELKTLPLKQVAVHHDPFEIPTTLILTNK